MILLKIRLFISTSLSFSKHVLAGRQRTLSRQFRNFPYVNLIAIQLQCWTKTDTIAGFGKHSSGEAIHGVIEFRRIVRSQRRIRNSYR